MTLDPRDMLERHGLRHTRQRAEVLRALLAQRWHPTAEELHEVVRAELAGVSLATVYNTLDVLVRRGLCRRLTVNAAAADGGVGACRYDGVMAEHAHVVTAAGEVRDVPEDLGRRVLASVPRELVEEVGRRLGMRVDRVSVQFLEDPAAEHAPDTDADGIGLRRGAERGTDPIHGSGSEGGPEGAGDATDA